MVGRYAELLPKLWQRFHRIVNPEIHKASDGCAFIRLPGFKYDDFNRAGILNIARLNKMSEMSRVNNSFMTSMSDVFLLMFGRNWQFTSALYDRAAVEFPMILRFSVAAIGKSSLDMWQTLEDESDGTLLASLSYRLVNIDPTIRASAVPFPEELRTNALKSVTLIGEKFPRLSPPQEIPKDAFSCQMKVRYDDMDLLFHTNQGSYLGFALECAAQASESGFYSCIREDIAFKRARKATAIHLAESHAGDELSVSTWEDASNPFLLHVAVSKQGNIIYYTDLEYFSS